MAGAPKATGAQWRPSTPARARGSSITSKMTSSPASKLSIGISSMGEEDDMGAWGFDDDADAWGFDNDPVPEPAPKPKPVAKTAPKQAAKPTPKPVAKPVIKPVVKPTPPKPIVRSPVLPKTPLKAPVTTPIKTPSKTSTKAEPKPSPIVAAKVVPKVIPKVLPKVTPKVTPKKIAAPIPEPVVEDTDAWLADDAEGDAWLADESPIADVAPEVKAPEPVSESAPEPIPEPAIEQPIKPAAAEPTPEPAAEIPMTEPTNESAWEQEGEDANDAWLVDDEPVADATPAPAPKPVIEAAQTPVPEPIVQSEPEPAAEAFPADPEEQGAWLVDDEPVQTEAPFEAPSQPAVEEPADSWMAEEEPVAESMPVIAEATTHTVVDSFAEPTVDEPSDAWMADDEPAIEQAPEQSVVEEVCQAHVISEHTPTDFQEPAVEEPSDSWMAEEEPVVERIAPVQHTVPEPVLKHAEEPTDAWMAEEEPIHPAPTHTADFTTEEPSDDAWLADDEPLEPVAEKAPEPAQEPFGEPAADEPSDAWLADEEPAEPVEKAPEPAQYTFAEPAKQDPTDTWLADDEPLTKITQETPAAEQATQPSFSAFDEPTAEEPEDAWLVDDEPVVESAPEPVQPVEEPIIQHAIQHLPDTFPPAKAEEPQEAWPVDDEPLLDDDTLDAQAAEVPVNDVSAQPEAEEAADSWLEDDTLEPVAAPAPAEAEFETEPKVEDAADAWGEDDGGDSWLADDEPITQQAPVAPVEPAVEEASQPPAAPATGEANFDDDEENQAWDLGRRDTDPFKFMPPSNRTNSFPAVTPISYEPAQASLHQPAEEADSQPWNASQAIDIVEEADKEIEEEELSYLNETVIAEPATQQVNGHATHKSTRSIGGQVQDLAAQQRDERYEEGLHLLPKQHTADESAQVPQNTAFTDPFGGQDEGGDDFFGKSQEEESTAPAPLQRKSTMQAMDFAGVDTTEFPSLTQTESRISEAVVEEPEAPVDAMPKEAPEEAPKEAPEEASKEEDLSSKWAAAFGEASGDESDLLDESDATPAPEVDATGFLTSDDDEGLLDDDDVDIDDVATVTSIPAATQPKPQAQNRYAPQNQQPAAPPAVSPLLNSKPAAPVYGNNFQQPQPPAIIHDTNRGESFAGKSKAGYASPYDLPSGFGNTKIRPRKKASMQSLNDQTQTAPPRVAGTSVGATQPPSMPPPAGNFQAPPTGPPKTLKKTPSTQSFFEDLPMGKPRPASRQSARAPSPAQVPHPQTIPSAPPAAQQQQPAVSPSAPDMHNLVAPPAANPYAALPSAAGQHPGPAQRYSPAPGQGAKTAPPPAASSRYSPAPNMPRHSPQSPPSASQAFLPHQPRTRSPLAQFEIHNDKGSHGDARIHRMPSLPSTREVPEEEDLPAGRPSIDQQMRMSFQGPPKPAASPYAPQPGAPLPPRSKTQSPGATRGVRPSGHAAQPSVPSIVTKAVSQGAYINVGRPRGASLLNAAPPANGTEHDPLQRWQGGPIMSWGVGGMLVTSFSTNASRYGMSQNSPQVHVKSIKDLAPLSERTAKFPGPLKGKSKKKEVVAWLSAGIDILEKETPELNMHHQLSLEAKRGIERLLLWRILRVFIEHDGHLEGNPAVEKAVRAILFPDANADGDAQSQNDYSSFGQEIAGRADGADKASLSKIRDELVKGNREEAVWAAVDKRLWGHALLIANTVSPDLYKRVTGEFVRKEVNANQDNESLGALYQIMAGNHEDCVDELVPSHARAGLQLMTTGSTSAAARDAMEGLDKWKETLALVLSNRSQEDVRGLRSLGQLLATYGRAEAAHICFMFSRAVSVFGGLEEPNVDVVLVGADHRAKPDLFVKEKDSLQLSEVYEYGLSLASTSHTGSPHLAAYKLRQSVILAEYSQRDKAMQYCDTILNAMSSQTKRSPYYHPILETSVDEFLRRLKDAPKGEGSSWMSKPSMNKVSDSMWNRFNKFVAGDDADGNAAAGSGDEHGPFARIASTPNLSRSPSVNNFESFGGNSPNFGMMPAAAQVPPPTGAGSRYAPMAGGGAPVHGSPYDFAAQQPPAPKPAASPYAPSPYQPSYPQSNGADSHDSGYPGVATPPSSSGYQPQTQPQQQQQQQQNSFEPPTAAPDAGPYQPHGGYKPQDIANASGPSRGASPYQPNSYQPHEQTEAPQPPANMYQPSSSGYQPTGLQESPVLTSQPKMQSRYQPSSYEPPQMNAAAVEEKESPYQPVSYEPPQTSAPNERKPSGYQPSSYEPPAMIPPPTAEVDQIEAEGPAAETYNGGGYEAPSYQPYSYEPPSYEPPKDDEPEEDEAPKPKKKSFMDDDDDIPGLGPQPPKEKTREEMDKENAEMVRKIAEQEEKAAAEAAAEKKAAGWGFGGWFGGAKKPEKEEPGKKAIKAKLGEANSFVYDPDLKRWINKAPGAENVEAPKPTPPPPRATPRPATATPPPPASATAPGSPAGSALPPSGSTGSLAPPMGRSASNPPSIGPPGVGPPSAGASTPAGPPSRPGTSMSNASSIDDLLGPPGPRKAGKKARKGRYVDVMAK